MKLKSAGWLMPEINTFKDASKVHFSRADGCDKTDDELKQEMEGTVSFHYMPFNDNEDGVVDKNGRTVKPKEVFEIVESPGVPGPICAECRWVSYFIHRHDMYCEKDSINPNPVDIVYGVRKGISCKEQRADNGNCKTAGLFFEQRKSTKPSFWKKLNPFK